MEIFHHYSVKNRVAASRTNSTTSLPTGTEPTPSSPSHGCLDFSHTRIINLGTGTKAEDQEPPHQSWIASLVPRVLRTALSLNNTLKNIAVDSEKSAKFMNTLARYSTNGSYTIKYERFSADTGVAEFKLDDFINLGEIETRTKQYLNKAEVQQRIKKVAKDIAGDYLAKHPGGPVISGAPRLAVPEPGNPTARPQTPEIHIQHKSQPSTDSQPSTRASKNNFQDGSFDTPESAPDTAATTPDCETPSRSTGRVEQIGKSLE